MSKSQVVYEYLREKECVFLNIYINCFKLLNSLMSLIINETINVKASKVKK